MNKLAKFSTKITNETGNRKGRQLSCSGSECPPVQVRDIRCDDGDALPRNSTFDKPSRRPPACASLTLKEFLVSFVHLVRSGAKGTRWGRNVCTAEVSMKIFDVGGGLKLD